MDPKKAARIRTLLALIAMSTPPVVQRRPRYVDVIPLTPHELKVQQQEKRRRKMAAASRKKNRRKS